VPLAGVVRCYSTGGALIAAYPGQTLGLPPSDKPVGIAWRSRPGQLLITGIEGPLKAYSPEGTR